MLERHRSYCFAGNACVGPLILRRQRLPPPEQCIPPQGDDGAHHQPPSVATMTALIVCIRFSASSKTSDAGDSNTSSVTSRESIPNFSKISLPTCVSAL